jgi:hypothetical protein
MDSEKIELIMRALEDKFNDDLIMDITKEYYDLLIERSYSDYIFEGIIDQYHELLEDYKHYGHYSWIALAMFQHQIGRLKKKVKTKALNILDNDITNYDELIDPILTLDDLCDIKYQLNTELPLRLKIPQPVTYICDWKQGDVFAFPLVDWESNFSKARSIPGFESHIHLIKEYGLTGKYIMFVTATIYKQGRVENPIVFIYNWYGDEPIYDLDKIKKIDYIPQNLFLSDFDPKDEPFKYNMELNFSIPKATAQKDNVIYIGNIGKMNFDITSVMNNNFYGGPVMAFDYLSGHIADRIWYCDYKYIEYGYCAFDEENKIVTIPKNQLHRKR